MNQSASPISSTDKATDRSAEIGWLVGCNYIPCSAINTLEMWQTETFDPAQIDKELGWASALLGFNSIRVFLHDLLWEQDPQGFLDRIDRFLAIAQKHRICVMPVLFDSCWNPNPRLGKQPDPIPGKHGSGWVQCPGHADLLDRSRRGMIEGYVTSVVERFKNDPRIVVWDIWNEPTTPIPGAANPPPKEIEDATRELLILAFEWTREVNPTQPLTSALFSAPKMSTDQFTATERVQIGDSDVISFHSYGKPEIVDEWIRACRQFDRPILCTEYLARPAGNTFDPILGTFKSHSIGAYNWGLVAGKTNTIFGWSSSKDDLPEPKMWYHDILRQDGTAFDPGEVEYIRSLASGSGLSHR